MYIERHARLFRNGRNPREFELPGEEVIIHKEGNRLIVEPVVKKRNLLELLATLEPLDEDFPDIEDPYVEDEDIF